MKDLDFDELDRAVNSLMKGAPKEPSEPSLTDEQTVTITPTVSDGAKPSLAKLNEAVANLNGSVEQTEKPPLTESTPALSVVAPAPQPASPIPAVATAAPSVAARRGKFMDVVRPGSGVSVTPTRVPSRQGITLDPSRPVVSDILSPTPTPTPPVSVSQSPSTPPSSVTAEPAPVVEAPVQAPEAAKDDSDWPDPMDIDYEPSDSKPSSLAQDTPLVSPFLPDAKVEKRPLGVPGVATDEAKIDPITDDASTSDDAAEAQLPASPAAEVEKLLPAELSNDLVALDADTNAVSTDESVSQNPTDEQVSSDKSPAADSQSNLSQPVAPTIPTGPISIPQQYKEEPSTGDKENGSIYDTDTYHKPLTHPAKKKSGWMWVVWIILILVLGAGVGAGLYLLGVF